MPNSLSLSFSLSLCCSTALTGLGAAQQNNSTQDTTSAAAAAGLLNPLAVQNLAAIAAMTQPNLSNAATSPGSAQLTNTAALLCKFTMQKKLTENA